jgi:galactose-1-phosphate uridylyltransferase
MFEQHGLSGSGQRQPDQVLPESRIDRLPEMIAALPEADRGLAERLFRVNVSEAVTVPPPEMEPWLERTFGSVDAVLRQNVVRVMNRWTFEGTTFNPLRSLRPGSGATGAAPESPLAELRERIERSGGDDFCDPFHHTPADMFGRIRGVHVTTAANVAKADGWHGVGIFDRHDPLMIDDDLVADMLATVAEWVTKVNATDAEARYPFVLWNCLWRAGASLVHGHVQMTLSHEMAHARVELLANAARRYHSEFGSDYFTDLAAVHRALGLAAEDDKADWFASLTPIKEREIVLQAPTYQDGILEPVELSVLADPLAATLSVMQKGMGVFAFNAAIFAPPIGRSEDGWSGFPLVARVVDRGNPLSTTSDFAGLELFGSSVVASDPFEVARVLRSHLPN